MDDDEITITNLDNITIDLNDYLTDTIDITTMSSNGITLTSSSSVDWVSVDWSNSTITPVEFEDCMPDVAKVEDMCRDYPALEKAYENFKTIYKLVHQDWQGRQDAES